jgi:hypothetical protein
MTKNECFYNNKNEELISKFKQIDIDNKNDLNNFIKELNLYKDIEFKEINHENMHYEPFNFDYTKNLSDGLQLDVTINTDIDCISIDLRINSICRENIELFEEFNNIYQIFQKDIIALKNNEKYFLKIAKKINNRLIEQSDINQEINNNITNFELFNNNFNFNKLRKIFIPNTKYITSFFKNNKNITFLTYHFYKNYIIFREHTILTKTENNETKYFMQNNKEITKEKAQEFINESFSFRGGLIKNSSLLRFGYPKLKISDLVIFLQPDIAKLNLDNF